MPDRVREVLHEHGPAAALFAVSAACFACGVAIGAQVARVLVRVLRGDQ